MPRYLPAPQNKFHGRSAFAHNPVIHPKRSDYSIISSFAARFPGKINLHTKKLSLHLSPSRCSRPPQSRPRGAVVSETKPLTQRSVDRYRSRQGIAARTTPTKHTLPPSAAPTISTISSRRVDTVLRPSSCRAAPMPSTASNPKGGMTREPLRATVCIRAEPTQTHTRFFHKRTQQQRAVSSCRFQPPPQRQTTT